MELNDKIKGAIVGYAYGDALGIGCEFMTRNEVRTYYPDGLRQFKQIIRDPHRSQWKRGEWTNETTLLTRFLKCVLSNKGFGLHALARDFKEWYDSHEEDMAPVYRLMCRNQEWMENPIVNSHRSWSLSRYGEASNDALQRAVVTALTSPEEKLMEHTRRFVLMTHDDSRCVTTTKILAVVFSSLLHKDKDPGIDSLKDLCLENDPRTLPFLKGAYDGDTDSLGVDNENSMTWTRTSMGAALWGYWHSDNAADTIHRVIDLGGDSDTNGALAGALAGIKYGYKALPEEIKNLKRLDYLLDLSDRVTLFVENQNK